MVSARCGQPARVLLIYDCAFLRKAVAAILNSEANLQVVGEAENGLVGLRLVLSLQPDVVVTDLEMPGMDGAEFITEQLQRRFVPIIIYSAVAFDSQLSRQARAAGAVDQIAKPNSQADTFCRQKQLKAAILAVLPS